MTRQEKEISMGLGGLHGISNENLAQAKLGEREPIIVTEAPSKEDVERLQAELDSLKPESANNNI